MEKVFDCENLDATSNVRSSHISESKEGNSVIEFSESHQVPEVGESDKGSYSVLEHVQSSGEGPSEQSLSKSKTYTEKKDESIDSLIVSRTKNMP